MKADRTPVYSRIHETFNFAIRADAAVFQRSNLIPLSFQSFI